MSDFDSAERPFSTAWVVLSVFLFLAVELTIGAWLGPLIAGKYVSPMFHLQVQVMLHLVSFFLGGLLVGVASPGRRLVEPAVGGAVSVGVVFLISFFLPSVFLRFDFTKLAVGGAIAFALALAGAWQGERMMGNLEPGDRSNRRARLRSALWAEDDGLLARRERERTRR